MLLTIQAFDLIKTVGELDKQVGGFREEKKALELQAYEKGKQADAIRVQLWYLLEVAKMAGWNTSESEHKYWQWYTSEKQDRNEYYKTEWRQVQYFSMVGFEFIISIAERFDLKRDKFEVNVSGYKQALYASNHDVNTHKDFEYFQKNYAEYDLSKKFRSLADANAHVEFFKQMLILDHKDEIQKQLDMVASITPEQYEYASNRRYI